MRPFIDLEYWFTAIYEFLRALFFGQVSEGVFSVVFVLKIVAGFLIIFFAYIIGYAFWQIRMLSKTKQLTIPLEKISAEELKQEQTMEWQKLKEHLLTERPSDWKIAVLEADIMLEQALRNKGYQGENLGEILKNIEPYKLKTLSQAWEAHKTRNKIAHEADREVTKIEANRAIGYYQEVLKELGFI